MPKPRCIYCDAKTDYGSNECLKCSHEADALEQPMSDHDEHCRHCRDGCPAGTYAEGDRDHESTLLPGVNVVGPDHSPILWADDSCPMCVEAERIRIADEIIDAINVEMNVKVQAGMARAATIVRGES